MSNFQNLPVAGQYMIGRDSDGKGIVVQVDAQGRLVTSGGGGGGGVSEVDGTHSPEADLFITPDFIRAISALFAWNGMNYHRVHMTGESLDVNITNQTIQSAAAVVPSDSGTITATKGLYIGGLGDVRVTIGGTDVTLTNLAIGVWHPIRVTAVKVTGTTATNILAGY